MKNEKFCFSKGTGLIAIVGILLVGFALLMGNTLPNKKTSTNSKASDPCAEYTSNMLAYNRIVTRYDANTGTCYAKGLQGSTAANCVDVKVPCRMTDQSGDISSAMNVETIKNYCSGNKDQFFLAPNAASFIVYVDNGNTGGTASTQTENKTCVKLTGNVKSYYEAKIVTTPSNITSTYQKKARCESVYADAVRCADLSAVTNVTPGAPIGNTKIVQAADKCGTGSKKTWKSNVTNQALDKILGADKYKGNGTNTPLTDYCVRLSGMAEMKILPNKKAWLRCIVTKNVDRTECAKTTVVYLDINEVKISDGTLVQNKKSMKPFYQDGFTYEARLKAAMDYCTTNRSYLVGANPAEENKFICVENVAMNN